MIGLITHMGQQDYLMEIEATGDNDGVALIINAATSPEPMRIAMPLATAVQLRDDLGKQIMLSGLRHMRRDQNCPDPLGR